MGIAGSSLNKLDDMLIRVVMVYNLMANSVDMIAEWTKHIKNGVSRNWVGRLRAPLCIDDGEFINHKAARQLFPRFCRYNVCAWLIASLTVWSFFIYSWGN